MACGGCKKSGGSTPATRTANLRKFAYLTPRQLRLLQQQEEAEKAQQQAEEEEGEN